MKIFIINCIRYILLLTAITFFSIILTTFICRRVFNYDIPPDKNFLIVGDSHIECALDDSILDNMYNLAQSGSSYFYSYVKAKAVIEHNPQIDTLIVGYSYGDLLTNRDRWFSGEEQIRFKLGDYFFLFSPQDYLDLVRANPLHTLWYTPQVIFKNFENIFRGYSSIGGYVYSERDRLKEAKSRYKEPEYNTSMKYSTYQEYYLLKIYNYCQSKGVQLVLINVPIHHILETDQAKHKDQYCKVALQKMPNAILMNDSNFNIPEYGYADLEHLNHKGAEIYSNYLKQSGITSSAQQCINYIK